MNNTETNTVYRGFPAHQLEVVKTAWAEILTDESLPLDTTFHSYIDSLNFESVNKSTRSIIISATMTPVQYSPVHFRGKKYIIRTPHQYYTADFSSRSVGEYIAEQEGLKEALVNIRDIPMKLTAAMCGLTEYGRNNIAYTTKYGSYITLMAFQSNEKHYDLTLKEPKRMDLCESCKICENRCPGAALKDRSFLQVEDCLSLYNEVEGAFPDKIEKMPHHALMGCLICQENCPANREIEARKEGETLDEEETEHLFLLNPSEKGLKGLEKLIGISDRKDLEESFSVYGRNFHFALKGMLLHSDTR